MHWMMSFMCQTVLLWFEISTTDDELTMYISDSDETIEECELVGNKTMA